MKAIAAYMANKTREGDNRRNEYHEPSGRDFDRRSEYDGAGSRVYNERQLDQYHARDAMGEYRPEDNEMRRRRDSGGRYMMDEPISPESRYRGRDGRWKAGTRRSEYDGGASDTYPAGRRMGDDDDQDDDVQSNVIQWPYAPGMPHMPPDSRMIGFGNRPREYETRSHYDGGRQEAEVGGTMWMQPVEDRQHERMDKQAMEKWVKHMRDDKDMPIKPWTVEEVKPLAMRFGYPTSGEKFDEFYTAIHMMKSDFCAVAEDFDVNTPAFFAALADAWLKDPDAALRGREKLEAYYKYIVMGKK